jgi:hypothetical protein
VRNDIRHATDDRQSEPIWSNGGRGSLIVGRWYVVTVVDSAQYGGLGGVKSVELGRALDRLDMCQRDANVSGSQAIAEEHQLERSLT